MTEITFTVPGVPAPQGSKTRTKWGVREDNAATRPWRTAVGFEALVAMGDRAPLTGSLQLAVRFYFPRPRSHYRSGKYINTMKPNAPHFHSSKPDADKLVRAIGDALTGIVVRDDSQFAIVTAVKVYGNPRAEICVSELARLPQAE